MLDEKERPSIEALETEIAQLKRTRDVLMRRVEANLGASGTAYAVFEQNVHLQRLIEARTEETRKAAERLREENRKRARVEDLLNASQRQAKVGGWVYDLATESMQGTAELYRIHEIPIGSTLTLDDALAYYSEDFRPQLQEALCDALGSGTPFDLQGRFRTAKGREIWVRVSGHPESDESRVTRITGLLADITEQRLVQAKAAQSQKLQSIGQLAAGVAHEINTPTQFVSDNVEFLRAAFESIMSAIAKMSALRDANSTSPLPLDVVSVLGSLDLEFLQSEVPTAFAQTIEGVGRISSLVRAMKDFAHPSSEEAEPSDINKAIASTVTVCRNEWKYVAQVALDLDPNLPQVSCYLAELNQVILNMVVNSAHAIDQRRTESGQTDLGHIKITTSAAARHVTIAVQDDGCGISEANRGRIFDPFFTTKPIGKGTGQGLAISHDVIVNKHKGSIEVESTPNVGTTMTIRLPIAHA